MFSTLQIEIVKKVFMWWAFVISFIGLLCNDREATTATAAPPRPTAFVKPWYCYPGSVPPPAKSAPYCSSWRTAVEADNMRNWPTVPEECEHHVEAYMICGQYQSDLKLVLDQMYKYIDGITLSGNGMDAWVLDVDETCLSNLPYYAGKRYGVVGYDPIAFRKWAQEAKCPAIPEVLALFRKLVKFGFKVILITGRDEQNYGAATMQNLKARGFIGYERLILRNETYKGLGAMAYKSQIRVQLEQQGYYIWGNVGDQWTDLKGPSGGNRTFKIPNSMYFVP